MAKGKYDITDYFVPTKKRIPMHKGGPLGMGFLGFTAPELMQMAYALFTTLLILFTWTGVDDAAGLLWQRVTALSGTLVLWVVYQLWPCKAVMMCRMGYLLLMLGAFYLVFYTAELFGFRFQKNSFWCSRFLFLLSY